MKVYLCLLATLVCCVVSIQSQFMADQELTQFNAGDPDHCCDSSGTWEGCPAVTQNCATSEVTVIPPEVSAVYGVECDDDGAVCEYADSGDSMATCDSTWTSGDECWLFEDQACNTLMSGTCDTDIIVGVYAGGFYYDYVCDCVDAASTLEYSLTQHTCSGHPCWL